MIENLVLDPQNEYFRIDPFDGTHFQADHLLRDFIPSTGDHPNYTKNRWKRLPLIEKLRRLDVVTEEAKELGALHLIPRFERMRKPLVKEEAVTEATAIASTAVITDPLAANKTYLRQWVPDGLEKHFKVEDMERLGYRFEYWDSQNIKERPEGTFIECITGEFIIKWESGIDPGTEIISINLSRRETLD